MKNFEANLESAAQFLKTHPKVIFAYLFGSMAAGSPTIMSDIDIAVYLEKSANCFEQKVSLYGYLCDIFQTNRLDVVLLNSAPPALAMNILKQKKLLVDKDPFKRHRYESLAIRQYFDFAPREIAMLEKKVGRG